MSLENELKKFEIPAALKAYFTDIEVEEMTMHFQSCDEDGSGLLDEDELFNLFKEVDVVVSREQLGSMIMDIDEDGNGLVDFDEFAMMMHKAKKGDKRFSMIAEMAASLNSTPVSILVEEAKKFNMSAEFEIVEEREATNFNPKMFVMQVTLKGQWEEGQGAKTVVCEAVGVSSRDAKFKVSQVAILKMKTLKPGMRFEPGVLPMEWQQWVLSNIDRGVPCDEVLKMINIKGFYPGRNSEFMQQVVLVASSASMLRKHPKTTVLTKDERSISPVWMFWIKEQLGRGIHSSLLLDEIRRRDAKAAMNPTLLQLLQSKSKIQQHEYVFSFKNCIKEGQIDFVKWYLEGGIEPNKDLEDPEKKKAKKPLELAALHGHDNIIRILVQKGADMAAKNCFGRTALLVATRSSHVTAVKELLALNADIMSVDNFGNTAVHLAAHSGHAQILELLADHQHTVMLKCMHNVYSMSTELFRAKLQALFISEMFKNLKDNEVRHFAEEWFPSSVQVAYEDLSIPNELPSIPIPKPTTLIIDFVLRRYHFGEGDEFYFLKKTVRGLKRLRVIQSAETLQRLIELVFREGYINLRNRQGRTPLHMACDENLVCSHENVIKLLVEKYGCLTEVPDNSGKHPYEYLVSPRGRLGSPTGSEIAEAEIVQDREQRKKNAVNSLKESEIGKETHDWHLYVEDIQDEIDSQTALRNICANISAVSTIRGWKVYYDTRSKNRFYERISTGAIQWNPPNEIIKSARIRIFWIELERNSVRMQIKGPWVMYKVKKTGKKFFYNDDLNDYGWNISTTKNLLSDEDWEQFDRLISTDDSSLTLSDFQMLRTFGEWEELSRDKFDLYLYHNTNTKEITWFPPDIVRENRSQYQAYSEIVGSAVLLEERNGWQKYFSIQRKREFFHCIKTGQGSSGTEVPEEFVKKDKVVARMSIMEIKEEKLMRRVIHKFRRKTELEEEKAMKALTSIDKVISAAIKADIAKRNQDVSSNEQMLAKIRAEHADSTESYLKQRMKVEKQTAQTANKMGIFTTEEARQFHESLMDKIEQERKSNERQLAIHCQIEDGNSTPRTVQRRRIIRLVEQALPRMVSGKSRCSWGCGLWFSNGEVLELHQKRECRQRLMTCRMGCGKVEVDAKWRSKYDLSTSVTFLEHHEKVNCPSRLVPCPKNCGMYISLEQIDNHTKNLCMKRPIDDLLCRLKCGKLFKGGTYKLFELEQERSTHESEACPERFVICPWPYCDEKLRAKDRNAHRKDHMFASGLVTIRIAGYHKYVIPKNVYCIKLQVWGAGGGSGHLKLQKFGNGGGGAFIEGILRVQPGEKLEVEIGGGGGPGKHGTMIERPEGDDLMVNEVRQSAAGMPGGGIGHSGNREWACGGGGGYTTINRRTNNGLQTILVAGGGGGGGCRDGLGATGNLDVLASEFEIDPINGESATFSKPGKEGISAANSECTFNATAGVEFQGGAGSAFGAGGGGGYLGGGGGGCAPGIAGGGGGGSSFVDAQLFKSKPIVIPADFKNPGGLDRFPPKSVGVADWDIGDGLCGEGAKGSKYETRVGNSGCVRIAIPGFFADTGHGCYKLKVKSDKESPRIGALAVASQFEH